VVDIQGRIQDFKLRGAHLKKVRRAEGGANIFGVFRVKNHDFTPKNHIFSKIRGARAGSPPGSTSDSPWHLFGVWCVLAFIVNFQQFCQLYRDYQVYGGNNYN
jgi:hypothetical protein